MTLLELLVKELPKRGGWPEGASHSGYKIQAGTVSFTENGAPGFNGEDLSIHTIYGAEGSAFWLPDARFKCEKPDDYATAIVTREQYESAIAEQKSVWNGEGLPPIGAKCEMRRGISGEWHPVIISFISEGLTVFKTLAGAEGCYHNSNIQFRPPHTEEASERAVIIESVADFLESFDFRRFSTYFVANEILEAIRLGEITGIQLSNKE